MTTETDPYAYDDAAYVLGALSDDDRRAFEAHLETCADCRAKVAEVRDVPALLAGITAADLLIDEPVPDTLLPGLLRRARNRRSRQHWLIGGLAAVAAACLVTIAVLVWPFGSSGNGNSSPQARPFVAVAQRSPVKANAALIAKAWGTEIDVHCSYAEKISESFPYKLRVYDKNGDSEDLGSWMVPVGHDMNYEAGTRYSLNDIAKLEILKLDGTAILQLRT